MIRESDIKHENGAHWVLDDRASYMMLRAGLTHSTSDSAYPRTPDGLSIAIARCDYLAKTRKPVTIGATLCKPQKSTLSP